MYLFPCALNCLVLPLLWKGRRAVKWTALAQTDAFFCLLAAAPASFVLFDSHTISSGCFLWCDGAVIQGCFSTVSPCFLSRCHCRYRAHRICCVLCQGPNYTNMFWAMSRPLRHVLFTWLSYSFDSNSISPSCVKSDHVYNSLSLSLTTIGLDSWFWIDVDDPVMWREMSPWDGWGSRNGFIVVDELTDSRIRRVIDLIIVDELTGSRITHHWSRGFCIVTFCCRHWWLENTYKRVFLYLPWEGWT